MTSIKDNKITIPAYKISLEEREDLAKYWINSANDGDKLTFSAKDIKIAYNKALLESSQSYFFKNSPIENFQIRLMRFLSIAYNTDEKLGRALEKEIIKESPQISNLLNNLYYRADMLPGGKVFEGKNIKLFLGEFVRPKDINRLKINFRKENEVIIFEGKESYINGKKFRYEFRKQRKLKLTGIKIQWTTKKGCSKLEFKAIYKIPNDHVEDDMNLSDDVLY